MSVAPSVSPLSQKGESYYRRPSDSRRTPYNRDAPDWYTHPFIQDYARRGGQVFVSTHSPDFLNGVKLDEIFWLIKEDGFTRVERASDNTTLKNLVDEGDLPGALWKQGLFEGAFP